MTAPAPPAPSPALLPGDRLTPAEAALAARYTVLDSKATAAKAAGDWPRWRQLRDELGQVATLLGGPLPSCFPLSHTHCPACYRATHTRRMTTP